ncbi:precorrin-4 C(11)-methyltransferase [Candidatus Acidianus copahuensis]|uniref:precorrin-4 C(11)-methyltransferase n=1 Tax=Candidatus Acidianus copahuensis TaxID=1160895 RepID=UPI00064E6EDF|nr:precorrin-4 C(11)-methyltransferase [Candidatus Acidianus copahuensis]
MGSGPGDPELITVKGKQYVEQADVIIYAGSLVNPTILSWAKHNAEIHDSSSLTLNEIVEIMVKSADEGKLVARLKSGDGGIYGALLEEMWALEASGIPFEIVPGITAAIAAASVLPSELTIPKISQSVIITRASLRVPMKGSLRDYAHHVKEGATMVIYTGVHIIEKVIDQLREGGLDDSVPVAVVYRATWTNQKIVKGTIGDIVQKVKKEKIYRDSVIIVGISANPDIVKNEVRSSVYDPSHNHSYRPWKVKEDD